MPNIEQRLQAARDNDKDYEPNNEVLRKFGERVVATCIIVGPSGSGKSTAIDLVCKKDGDFFVLGTIGSRKSRATDPPNYVMDIPKEKLLDKIESEEVLQYGITDDGEIYTSTLESIEDGIMIVPVLSSGIEQFLRLSNKAVVIGIVTSGAEYEKYLTDRRGDVRFKERMEEALLSLKYLRERSEYIPIIENNFGKQDEMAIKVVGITKENPQYRGNSRRINRKIEKMIAVVERELEKLS